MEKERKGKKMAGYDPNWLIIWEEKEYCKWIHLKVYEGLRLYDFFFFFNMIKIMYIQTDHKILLKFVD